MQDSVPTEIGPFIFIEKLGQGAHGVVYRGEHKDTKLQVAIKCVSKLLLSTSQQQTRLMREISLLKKINHPMIVQLFNVYEDENYHYLIMEYVENGNLYEFVSSQGNLREPVARRYFLQLLSVLDYLHNNKHIAHRDLKLENILLDRYYNIRVVDFGLSNCFTEDSPLLNTSCGTPQYVAPEMVRGMQYTKSADIWSAGIVLYAMTVGSLPFDCQEIPKLMNAILYSQPVFPDSMSPALKDLISKMLAKSSDGRISIERIKEHPWFSPREFTAINDYAMKIISEYNSEECCDKNILERMKAFNYDISNIKQKLFLNECDDITATYRLMKKDVILLEMKNATRARPGLIKTATPQPKGVRVLQKADSQKAVVHSVKASALVSNQENLEQSPTKVTPKFVPPKVVSRRAMPRCLSTRPEAVFNA